MPRRRPKRFLHNPSSHSRLRRRWRRWLPSMKNDLSILLGKREIFWELQEVAQENQRILRHGSFFNWMCTNYIAAVSMEVRRFQDSSRDVRSLWRLLYEIYENPGVVNRRSNRCLYRGVTIDPSFDIANLSFNNVVGKNKDVLPQRDVLKDLRNIESSSDRIRKFVNKRIAHRTPLGELRRLPIFNELDHSMDTIDRIFCKYNLLLTAEGTESMSATRQYDWMEVLHEAWVMPGSKFRLDV